MAKSVESVCILIAIVGCVMAAVAWMDNKPSATTSVCLYGGVLAVVAAVGVILYLQFRPDLIPDYLRAVDTSYFNRDGFCFTFKAEAIKGIACMTVYFQNQYARPCIGKIALRPAQKFWLNRAPIKAINYIIQCEPAAYGIARIAIPLAKELQGTRQSFDVGASVVYVKGKGRRLRFRHGLFLRTNEKFGNSFETGVMIAHIATGHVLSAAAGRLVGHKPAQATISMPQGVAEQLPGEIRTQVKTLWRLKDPPLKMAVTES
jgi:hypothetical protein